MLRLARTRAGAVALAACTVVGLAACNSTPSSSGGDDSDIQIGVVLSTSGPGAVYGVDQLNGVKLAVQFINDAGGIDGRNLKIDFKDSAYDKTQAQSIISKMAPDDSIVGLIGPTSSAEAFAADPIANSAKLPVLAISNGSEGIPQIGEYVHRVGVPEPLLLPGVVKTVVAKDDLKSAAILYASDDPFALTGEQAFSKELKAEGISITDTVAYDSAKTVNFVPQLQTIRGHHPDALFLAVKADEGAVILRQAQQQNLNIPLVGNLAFTSTSLLQAAGSAGDGLIVGGTWSPADPSALNKKFVSNYQAQFHKPPTPLAATAFNSVYVIKSALAGKKSFERADLQAGLTKISGYNTIGSPVKFVDVGNGLRDASTPKPVLLQAKDGQLVPLG